MKNISTKSSLVVVNIFEEEGDQYRILLSFLSLSERVVFLENSRGILEVKQTIFPLLRNVEIYLIENEDEDILIFPKMQLI